MARRQIMLGGNAYLFEDTSYNNIFCVIDAHGGYNRSITKPTWKNESGAKLHFLANHDDSVFSSQSMSSDFFEELGSLEVAQTVKQGVETWDYVLTKFVHSNSTSAKTYEDHIKGEGIDVVTVRNRWWHEGVTLSWLTHEIAKHHKYKAIYCKFCRKGVSKGEISGVNPKKR